MEKKKNTGENKRFLKIQQIYIQTWKKKGRNIPNIIIVTHAEILNRHRRREEEKLRNASVEFIKGVAAPSLIYVLLFCWLYKS